MAIAQGAAPALALNHKGYFSEPGLDVMVFSNYFPDGHQAGAISNVPRHWQRCKPLRFTDVAVKCSTNTFIVSGTISGLGASTGLVLFDNGGDATTVPANANAFAMNTSLASPA